MHTYMEKLDISCSNKNIAVPSKLQYTIQLTSKVEQVVKRPRWKCPEFLGKLSSNVSKKSYGFNH